MHFIRATVHRKLMIYDNLFMVVYHHAAMA